MSSTFTTCDLNKASEPLSSLANLGYFDEDLQRESNSFYTIPQSSTFASSNWTLNPPDAVKKPSTIGSTTYASASSLNFSYRTAKTGGSLMDNAFLNSIQNQEMVKNSKVCEIFSLACFIFVLSVVKLKRPINRKRTSNLFLNHIFVNFFVLEIKCKILE